MTARTAAATMYLTALALVGWWTRTAILAAYTV